MEPSKEFFIKLLNIWYCKEPPQYEMSDGMKRFAADIVVLLQHGDDKIFSHPKINEIIILLKDYGLIDYDKSIMDIYFEGRMRTQIEIREMFNAPEVSMAFEGLMNVVGKMAKKFEEAAKKQIEKEKNISAVPELAKKHIFQN